MRRENNEIERQEIREFMIYDRTIRNKLTGLWTRFNNATSKYAVGAITEKEYKLKLDYIKLLADNLDIGLDGDIQDYKNLIHAMHDTLTIYGIN